MKKTKTYQSDWLASYPIFYHEKTGAISHNVNDVIDYSNLIFHPEGLANYLSWGYSVFGQTPIKNVKFLLPNQIISSSPSHQISIIDIPDPVAGWSHKPTKPGDVIELIETKVKSWQKLANSPLI